MRECNLGSSHYSSACFIFYIKNSLEQEMESRSPSSTPSQFPTPLPHIKMNVFITTYRLMQLLKDQTQT